MDGRKETDKMPAIRLGTTIEVDAAMFDALLDSGLLDQWGFDGTKDGTCQWPVWGENLENGNIRCRLVTEMQWGQL